MWLHSNKTLFIKKKAAVQLQLADPWFRPLFLRLWSVSESPGDFAPVVLGIRHSLVTLSGQSLESSGSIASPWFSLLPTFAPDQLLQLILQGWKPYNGNLYYFSQVKKSWQEAEQFCVSQGAHLASVTSEEEQVSAVGLGEGSETWVVRPSPLGVGMAETFVSPLSAEEQIFTEFW